ncbi:MAG: phenylacetate--CoA ligase [Acidobacteria bacterium]|nr:phenylacetate--CoA ligase [Acidobacteriota bacterium]
MDAKLLFEDVRKTVPAYQDFLSHYRVPEHPEWEEIPITNKKNYLLSYPVHELYRKGMLKDCFLIGASSGFSKSGTVFWLKEAVDERVYLNVVRELLIQDYGIGNRSALIIVSLAFGTWIGGMQLACTMRSLAAEMENVTVATPGMNLREGVEIAKIFGKKFDVILWLCNPSSINILHSLLKNEKSLLKGKIFFPVIGEYFSENYRESVAEKFGHDRENAVVIKTGYGSADAGDLGIESKATIGLRKFFNRNRELSRRVFSEDSPPMIFEMPGKSHLEIIGGELIVSRDQFIPLIRYNTGDRAGLLRREALKGLGIDPELFSQLPEEMLYVYGRAKNAIVFYGTNLDVNKIGDFLDKLGRSYAYAGLFEIRRQEKNKIDFFEFTVYTSETAPELSDRYREKLIGFLKGFSNEFAAKYDELKSAAGEHLITVDVQLIKDKVPDKKHRIIIEE